MNKNIKTKYLMRIIALISIVLCIMMNFGLMKNIAVADEANTDVDVLEGSLSENEFLCDMFGHDYGDPEVHEPTNENNGFTVYTCKRCGAIKLTNFTHTQSKVEIKNNKLLLDITIDFIEAILCCVVFFIVVIFLIALIGILCRKRIKTKKNDVEETYSANLNDVDIAEIKQNVNKIIDGLTNIKNGSVAYQSQESYNQELQCYIDSATKILNKVK